MPVTLQGGEPSLHRDFIYIINHLRRDIPIDILTNLNFDFKDFSKRVDLQRLKRDAPYAPIRASYHPEKMNLYDVLSAVLYLKVKGFDVGVWCIEHPAGAGSVIIDWARKKCKEVGIDFRTKEFLGRYKGSLYGTYKYPIYNFGRRVLCKATELLIAPDARVYRCHRDLYLGENSIGSMLDNNFQIEDKFKECDKAGLCNPCDLKIKFDRFQEEGHCSVIIVEEEKDANRNL